jgi:hypothetical protein
MLNVAVAIQLLIHLHHLELLPPLPRLLRIILSLTLPPSLLAIQLLFISKHNRDLPLTVKHCRTHAHSLTINSPPVAPIQLLRLLSPAMDP